MCGYPINSGTRSSGRVGCLSSSEISGYPVATSDTWTNRISELTGYATQLGHLMWFGKLVSTKNLQKIKRWSAGIKVILSYSLSTKFLKILVVWMPIHSSTQNYSSAQRHSSDQKRSNIRRHSSTRRRSSSRRHSSTRRRSSTRQYSSTRTLFTRDVWVEHFFGSGRVG